MNKVKLKKIIFIIVCLSLSIPILSEVKADDTVVKSVKYRVTKGSYKRVHSKTKYSKAIKISWKKVKGVTGYEVSVYGKATKSWRVVKRTKKTYYSITNMLKKDKVKVKVRTYTDNVNGRQYGKWSKMLKFTTGSLVAKRTGKGKIKTFYDRYAAEQAFVLQNTMRNNVGSPEMVWSEAAYKIALQRAKDISKDFNHDKFKSTSLEVLAKAYGVSDLKYEYDVNGFIYDGELVGGENIAVGQTNYKHVMRTWKSSPGHYMNLKASSYKSGAIACYWNGKTTYWVAIFSETDLDAQLKQIIK